MKKILFALLLGVIGSDVWADSAAELTRKSGTLSRFEELETKATIQEGGSDVSGSPDTNNTSYSSSTYHGLHLMYRVAEVDYSTPSYSSHHAKGDATTVTDLADNNGSATTGTVRMYAGGIFIAEAETLDDHSPPIWANGEARGHAYVKADYEYDDDMDVNTTPQLYAIVRLTTDLQTADASPGIEAIKLKADVNNDINITATYSPAADKWTVTGWIGGTNVNDTINGFDVGTTKTWGSLSTPIASLSNAGETLEAAVYLDPSYGTGLEGVDTEVNSGQSSTDFDKSVRIDAKLEVEFKVRHVED